MVKKSELREVLKDILQEELKPISDEVKEIKTYLLGNEYQSGAKPLIEKAVETTEEVRRNLTIVKANKAERYTTQLEQIKAKEYVDELIKSEAAKSAETIQYFKRTWKIGIAIMSALNFPSFMQLINFIYQYIPK